MPNVLLERQQRLLEELTELVRERAAGEASLDRDHADRDRAVVERYQTSRQQLTEQFEADIGRLRGDYSKRREETIYHYEANSFAVVQEAERFDKDAAEERERGLGRAKRQWQVAKRIAEDEFNENKGKPKQELERQRRRWEKRLNELQQIWGDAERVLRRRRVPVPDDQPTVVPRDGKPLEQYEAALHSARLQLREMTRQPAAEFLEKGWPFLIFLFVALGLVWPLGYWQGWTIGIVASLVIAIVLALSIRAFMLPRARRQTAAALPPLQASIAQGEVAQHTALRFAEREANEKHAAIVEKRDNAISQAHAQWSRTRVELQQKFEDKVQAAAEEFKARRQRLKDTYHQDLKGLDDQYPPRIAECEQSFAERSQQLLDERQQQLEANQQALASSWDALVTRWRDGVASFAGDIEEMNQLCGQRAPNWDQVDWSTWEPDNEELPALRFGSLDFQLAMLPDGISENERLQVSPTSVSLPVALSYPECPSLLYLAEGDARDLAVTSLQDVMLRLLTSLPPGKVRYTIVDPTGLGQNFSAFMHLADFDEKLVSSRIWTEAVHINKRLSDLTEHMENVIQKYLRNEYESIQEYNRHAGEVAEPFQILVVANFPANFTEESARRLVSIAQSGARCGVYTLISNDRKLRLPRNFDLADLQTNAVTLEWQDGRFRLPDSLLGDLPLTLEQPPSGNRFTEIVRTVGEQAKDASRVEVPFASVAAPDGQWWQEDSRSELVVPLGRAGATNLQFMRLGKGTSQHVLISGKTGSGKSTLLHTLITNLATYYSPDEVQFYLIDFKKGVEFKAYASLELPHARVIAIESEREFGLSVLERMDGELKSRGDLFREHGVQDLKGFRDANPGVKMPRVLLIIDEFQEFFVKDDKISQDASLLLDRLVRQGRAFGIHVLLGSQTLAGAYSLARATIGQMAVRIALQCSEGDAHLILSDDNTAARLLSRPGEAIYNDANGLFEGNHPFQVVWLPDHEREMYLRRISELADERALTVEPAIVFEGNTPADPAKNEFLRAALSSASPAANPLAPRAWLGAAVAIKEPACAVFRRQSGSNLLVVGQQEEAALGVLANCLVSLAAELFTGEPAEGAMEATVACESPGAAGSLQGAGPPRFYILDGQRPDSPIGGFWKGLARTLPTDIQVAGSAEVATVIDEITTEVDRRIEAGDETSRPIFLLIFNLSRFRDLRKGEDFSFSFDDNQQGSQLDKQLARLLREGPGVAAHSLIWCDGYTNVNRWIDRQTMHDLSLRVLFQMGAADSANLMDSPEASRLGIHRAIFFDEEQGDFEKFRPYGPPDSEWLAWVRDALTQRMADTHATDPMGSA